MYRRLSHTITQDTPRSSPLVAPLEVAPVLELARGDNSNLYRVALTNHYGTHIDAPNHFHAAGLRLVDLPGEAFVFHAPCVLDVPKGDLGLITPEDLAPHEGRAAGSDLVMLRTGFGALRASDPVRYASRNPGLSGEAAAYLVERFPLLRCLALDTISLEWISDDSHGWAAHRVLLGQRDRPVLVIEDLCLDFGGRTPGRVFAFPLLVDGVDSFPCTVLGEFADA